MEADEDMLYYSHQKLSGLIQQRGDKEAAIKDYLSNLNFQPVKDCPPGLEWFNVSEPLSFTKHLKGKIVLLDFFTYCCINCMHILPDLRELEQQFSIEDGLVVIGVHSAKFENEKVSKNILSAVQRYNVSHPVVNDSNSVMWKNCDIHCWPTLLILGPNANPIVMLMGEGHKENLRLYIGTALDYYKSRKEISNHSLPLKSAYHLLPDLKGPLLFPGKITNVIRSDGSEILAVSDTGNNRILVFHKDGTILHQIGSGKVGFRDGKLHKAEFNAPQGVCFLNESILFVADTENHALRKIDLDKKQVETVAGTGLQGNDKIGGKLWKEQEISSPWDVCIYRTADMDMTFYPDGNPPLRHVLIVAMAGTHQIWALFLDDTVWWKCKKYQAGTCLCIAGSGLEENRNNSYPHAAAFAQPSGLALSYRTKDVYIADSESSSIRRLSLVDGKVTPVVGADRNPKNLFAFGDKDGTLYEAKLQHALGLALSKDETVLFVADTYNHKMKKVNVDENTITTLNCEASFNEPSGLCVSDAIYLADTNNHAIKILQIDSNYNVKSVTQLHLNLPKALPKDANIKHDIIRSKEVAVSEKGAKIIVDLGVAFLNNLALTQDAPQQWSVDLPDATWSCVPSSGFFTNKVDCVLSAPAKTINAEVDFVFNLVLCGNQACLPKYFIVRIPFNSSNEASTNENVNLTIELAENSVVVK